MFCSKCGNQLPDEAKFCSNCGAGTMPEVSAPSSDMSASQPVQFYSQPSVNNPEPQNTVYPPMNYSNVPPQQTYYPNVYNATVYNAEKQPRFPAFPFIAAGSMILTILMIFLPWVSIFGEEITMVEIMSLEYYLSSSGAEVMGACLALFIIAIVLMLPGIILAFVRRHKMPIGFSIASSVLIFFNLILFLVVLEEFNYAVEPTAAPFLVLILAVANIVFTALARKVK